MEFGKSSEASLDSRNKVQRGTFRPRNERFTLISRGKRKWGTTTCAFRYSKRRKRERERKGYTRGYLLPSSCQGTLVDGERERERERSWKWVSSSCDCFGFDLGSIYRVYTRICLNPPPSHLSSSETRHQLRCTDTKRERERQSLQKRVQIAMGSSTSRNVE